VEVVAMSSSGTARKAFGDHGESIAARHLIEAGLTILDRNWRCETGEIDIVARDGASLVVCEVKTRRGLAYCHPGEAVTWRKAQRLRRLAMRWIDEHDVHPPEIRIDVVSVVCPPAGEAVVEHLRAVC
jgi:putative endonuclease